ncbi:unnamed protein product, partial [marine sediment metagenome]
MGGQVVELVVQVAGAAAQAAEADQSVGPRGAVQGVELAPAVELVKGEFRP